MTTVLDDTGSHHGPDIAAGVEVLCDDLIKIEGGIRALVDKLKAHASYAVGRGGSKHALRSEAIACAILALRHVEDASVRIAAVLEYANQP